ncbi:DNA-deoxyinosine glycosylase [Rhodococcus spelaei]|uniref:DNA-deoxyinosine glycosylase n=1 Tax=Rhodococcus spelaei TaxID=2546320 RepID=A0A541B1Z7_9NOCA|nr:DNA-deoxyinosine glycosylase [Rhodococcus spelaei]TQF66331.1 DNA-deoxyinosine glycosylase [Rhodococcus spelaei]
MTVVQGFPAVIDDKAQTLVLGSMPGVPSLVAGKYYANPRNSFWPIMGELFDAGPPHPYRVRVHRLQSRGVALWDVLKLCRRPGSLDSSIDRATEVPNDFAALFAGHRGIRRVFFNGAKAEEVYRRTVVSAGLHPEGVDLTRLPSTSPANAGTPVPEKVEAWRVLVHG